MNSNLLTLDTAQSLIRAALKIGGGFLVAKGLAEESTLEIAIAGVVALVGIIWGICHRVPSGPSAPPKIQVPLFLFLTVGLLATGCASANTKVFRAEKLATDTAYAGLVAWKAYYASAVTNVPSSELPALQQRNESIFAASRKFAAAMSSADALRETCATNAAAGKSALQVALAAAQAHASNLVSLVQQFLVESK